MSTNYFSNYMDLCFRQFAKRCQWLRLKTVDVRELNKPIAQRTKTNEMWHGNPESVILMSHQLFYLGFDPPTLPNLVTTPESAFVTRCLPHSFDSH